jgi:hypothetical protein
MKFSPPARGGKGYATCDATGFPVPAENRVQDVRQGKVETKRADAWPGFGTEHPLDKFAADIGGDPTAIDDARPVPVIQPSAADLGLTDQERERRLREAPPAS